MLTQPQVSSIAQDSTAYLNTTISSIHRPAHLSLCRSVVAPTHSQKHIHTCMSPWCWCISESILQAPCTRSHPHTLLWSWGPVRTPCGSHTQCHWENRDKSVGSLHCLCRKGSLLLSKKKKKKKKKKKRRRRITSAITTTTTTAAAAAAATTTTLETWGYFA